MRKIGKWVWWSEAIRSAEEQGSFLREERPVCGKAQTTNRKITKHKQAEMLKNLRKLISTRVGWDSK